MYLVSEGKFRGSGVHLQTRGLNRGIPVKSDNLNQYAAITGKRYEIGHKLVLFTDSIRVHTSFRSVSKSVTFRNLQRPTVGHYALFHIIRQLLESTASDPLKLDPCCQQRKYSPGSLFLPIYGLWGTMGAISAVAELLATFSQSFVRNALL